MKSTQEEREAALAAEQEKERQEARVKWRVLDFLDLGDSLWTSVCWHNRKEGSELKPFASVSVSLANSIGHCAGALGTRAALSILRRFQARGDIQTVPMWQEPGFSAVWWPDECNCSRLKKGAEKVGEAQIELTATGNSQYHARSLAFWVRLPDGDREFVELHLNLDRLPKPWEHHPKFTGFSRHDGSVTSLELAPPPGLGGGACIRKGLGSPGSWRSETYWTTSEDFISQLLLTQDLS
jgi:hypothetical protein